jgi:hypothetical protein
MLTYNVIRYTKKIVTFHTKKHVHVYKQVCCSKLQQCCYFGKLPKACHSRLVNKLPNCMQDDNKSLEQGSSKSVESTGL